MESIELDQFAKKLQSLLAKPPLIVLGSGASAPYGLPTMAQLANAIAKDERIAASRDAAKLITHIEAGVNLEKAINESAISADSIDLIRAIIWSQVNAADRRRVEQAIHDEPTPLEAALTKILNTAGRHARIVTTNYDRLAEIAIDRVGATCIDGFFGQILRRPDLQLSSVRAVNTRRKENTVELWKVHGSLDWFSGPNGDVFALPFCHAVPDGCVPLIVPPSKEKYAETSQDPYRDIITQADRAFQQSQSFLCIGYGFGDNHIHPHLKREAESGKPIVILARTLTPNCREWIRTASLRRFMALERDSTGDGTTHVWTNDDASGLSDYYVSGDYWNIGKLVEIW